MYESEVKLLLKYLIYKCKIPKTYHSLALTYKYAAELAKYYSPMKRKEFCKKLKTSYDMGMTENYVLPNGRVLKSVSDDLSLFLCCQITTTIIFDVLNNTSFRVVDYYESGYIAEYNSYHFEYINKNKSKSLAFYKYQIRFRVSDLYLECTICPYCNNYHTFTFYTTRNYKTLQFYLSSFCGLNLKYLTPTEYRDHNKRRRVINSVILYSKDKNKRISKTINMLI